MRDHPSILKIAMKMIEIKAVHEISVKDDIIEVKCFGNPDKELQKDLYDILKKYKLGPRHLKITHIGERKTAKLINIRMVTEDKIKK